MFLPFHISTTTSVLGYYFDKKRALATGISVCGSGAGIEASFSAPSTSSQFPSTYPVIHHPSWPISNLSGAFVLPPIAALFLQHYDWKVSQLYGGGGNTATENDDDDDDNGKCNTATENDDDGTLSQCYV